jgi:glycosyltransferase involved in cell wall biosynthesis
VAIQTKELQPLNLIALYEVNCGETDLALKLIQRSLAINPDQDDMKLLLESIEAGAPLFVPLCLSPVPRLESVAFYTPAYNAEPYIEQVLDALLTQNYPLDEIIVVDDGSSDRTAEIALEHKARLVRFEENKGLSAARNAAFQTATSKFLGSVDADVCADSDYATHIMIEFENGLPSLAGVGGRLIEQYTDAPADAWRTMRLPQGWYPRRMCFGPLLDYDNGKKDSEQCPIFFLNGCNNIFRRDYVNEVGGYNEKFKTNAEDGEICLALRAHGRHLSFTRNAITRHIRRDTIQSVLRTAWRYGFWGREEYGYYSNIYTMFGRMHINLNKANEGLAEDYREGRLHLAYLDFLALFIYSLSDIKHAVDKGLLSKKDGAFCQREILRASEILEKERGKQLRERLEKDCAGLFIEAPQEENAYNPEINQLIEAFSLLLTREFETYPEEAKVMIFMT